MKKLAIIGAGASGLCAAIEAKLQNADLNITVFERLQKPGKKILATGNGRCNFSNQDLAPKHFYGEKEFLRSVLTSSFSDDETFFRELGVLTYVEDGRIYPRSQQASTIRDALLEKCNELGVAIKAEKEITDVKRKGNAFYINNISFDSIIFACGGKASSVQGSDGSSFKAIENLGHKFTELYPALCGLKTTDKDLNQLKGVRCKCKAALIKNNEVLKEESGEVQFTNKAVSGIPVMNLSQYVKSQKNLLLYLDLCEEMSFDEIFEFLVFQKKTAPTKEFEALLSGIVNNKLAYVIIKKAKIKPHTLLSEINSSSFKDVCKLLKSFEIAIDGTKGFDNAQITCGGVETMDIGAKTMMSKLVPGLFFSGEILDIHGDCGGYNLHLAWTTGRIAGSSAAIYLS